MKIAHNILSYKMQKQSQEPDGSKSHTDQKSMNKLLQDSKFKLPQISQSISFKERLAIIKGRLESPNSHKPQNLVKLQSLSHILSQKEKVIVNTQPQSASDLVEQAYAQNK